MAIHINNETSIICYYYYYIHIKNDKICTGCEKYPNETNNCNKQWRTALHLSMFKKITKKEENKFILSLLHFNPHAILLRDKLGYTPLHIACQFNSKNYDIIYLLCTIAIDVEYSFLCNNTEDNKHCFCKCFYCGICYYLRYCNHGYYDGCTCTYYKNNEIHNGKKDDYNNDIYINSASRTTTISSSPLYIACQKDTTSIKVLELLLNMSKIHCKRLKTKYDELLQACNCECSMHGEKYIIISDFIVNYCCFF